MSCLHDCLNRALRLFPAETAHTLALRALSLGLGPHDRPDRYPSLAQTLWGLRFPNPLGISAGFDKNARAIGGVMGMGVGFVEVGGVTPLAQAGNPRPRLFRLTADEGVINRLGFNNDGAAAIRDRLAAFRQTSRDGRPLGVNMAANATSTDPAGDFVTLVETFAPLADYLTVDVSCPNTQNGQVFLEPRALEGLMARLNETRDASGAHPAMLAKLAPDLDGERLGELLAVLRAAGIDGMILCNTTTARPETLRSAEAAERGGLSGRPLFERATAMLRDVYARTNGEIPLVGVGGIMDGADAYAKIRAGASLVQIYSGLVYGGPGLLARIRRDLAGYLARDGFASITDAVGADHR